MEPISHKLPLPLTHGVGSPIAKTVAAARRLGTTGSALVYGEPGTGKGALARLIHESASPAGPFLILRCGGRDEGALTAELFGGQGAAPDARRGVLAQAGGGTLYLEEVGDLPIESQGRLVSTLAEEDGTGSRGEAPRTRLVASSTRELLPLVACGSFRRELYDSLATKLRLPPVRERHRDVLAIVDRIWASRGERRVISEGARALMQEYTWPGNAREIVAFVQRLAASCTVPVISVRDVERELFTMATGLSCWGPPEETTSGAAPGEAEQPAMATRRVLLEAGLAFADDERVDLPGVLRRIEGGLIEWALRRTAGNKAGAAQLLGLQRTTLAEKLRRRREPSGRAVPHGDGFDHGEAMDDEPREPTRAST